MYRSVHLGVHSGCTKAESLRTRWYILPKTKTCRIITQVFHFDGTCFILRFLLSTSFKTVGEPLHLLPVHPKLIFLGAPKSTIVCKNLPRSLALMLLIIMLLSFLPSFSGISLECALNSHNSQGQPLVHPKLLSKLRILSYFSKTWLKIWRKSWWSSLLWWNRSIS